jgi:hypothetical protein
LWCECHAHIGIAITSFFEPTPSTTSWRRVVYGSKKTASSDRTSGMSRPSMQEPERAGFVVGN